MRERSETGRRGGSAASLDEASGVAGSEKSEPAAPGEESGLVLRGGDHAAGARAVIDDDRIADGGVGRVELHVAAGHDGGNRRLAPSVSGEIKVHRDSTD